jgi:hypothetical protein
MHVGYAHKPLRQDIDGPPEDGDDHYGGAAHRIDIADGVGGKRYGQNQKGHPQSA